MAATPWQWGVMEPSRPFILPEQTVTIPVTVSPFTTSVQYNSRPVSPIDPRLMPGAYDGPNAHPQSKSRTTTPIRRPLPDNSPSSRGFTGYVESSKEVSPFMPKKPPPRDYRSLSPAVNRVSGRDTMYVNNNQNRPYTPMGVTTGLLVRIYPQSSPPIISL
jgi:hypothetical protein